MRSDSILIIMIIMIIFVLIDTYIIFKNIRSYQRLTFLSNIETFHNFIASCSERRHRRFRVRSSAVTSRGGCGAGAALSTGRGGAGRSRRAGGGCTAVGRPLSPSMEALQQPVAPAAPAVRPLVNPDEYGEVDTSRCAHSLPSPAPRLRHVLRVSSGLFLFLTCSDTIYRPSENRHENPLKRSMSLS